MNPDLLIACATLHEISVFLDRYPPESEMKFQTGISVFSGRIDQTTYDLVVTGPGVFNTAHALTAYLEKKTPAFVFQTGIAGVFKDSGLLAGDVAVAEHECYIHTGIQSGSMKHAPLPFDLINKHPSARQGKYLFEKARVDQCYEKLVTAFKNQAACVDKGLFITVSTVTASKDFAARLYSVFESPVMEAMEGAASAHIALLYDIGFLEVRAASNFVGERDKSKWDIQKAVNQIPQICRVVAHKMISMG